jgi:hypothetical protein
VHRLLDLRHDGPARRHPRHEPQQPHPIEAHPPGQVPIDRLAALAPTCQISPARVVDARRISTTGGIAWHRAGLSPAAQAGYDENLISQVARVMDYHDAYHLDKDDLDTIPPQA